MKKAIAWILLLLLVFNLSLQGFTLHFCGDEPAAIGKSGEISCCCRKPSKAGADIHAGKTILKKQSCWSEASVQPDRNLSGTGQLRTAPLLMTAVLVDHSFAAELRSNAAYLLQIPFRHPPDPTPDWVRYRNIRI